MLEEEDDETGFNFLEYTSVEPGPAEGDINKAQQRYRKNILDNHIFPALEDIYGEKDAVVHFQTILKTNPYEGKEVREALKFYEENPYRDFRLREEAYGWWVFNQ